MGGAPNPVSRNWPQFHDDNHPDIFMRVKYRIQRDATAQKIKM